VGGYPNVGSIILARSLIDGKAEEVGKLTERALDDGVPPDGYLTGD
jgi:hypothetical protein